MVYSYKVDGIVPWYFLPYTESNLLYIIKSVLRIPYITGCAEHDVSCSGVYYYPWSDYVRGKNSYIIL